jgi:hypothetical protein
MNIEKKEFLLDGNEKSLKDLSKKTTDPGKPPAMTPKKSSNNSTENLKDD